VIGQAAGTAAAIAIEHGTTPRGVYESHLVELQQSLMRQDSYLPGVVRAIAPISSKATLAASNAGAEYTVTRARTEYLDGEVVLASGLRGGQRIRIAHYEAKETADPEVLRNGVDRTVGETDNGYWCEPGDTIEYRFGDPTPLARARIVFDSDLSRHYKDHRMKYHYPLDDPGTPVAASLVKRFRVEVSTEGDSRPVAEVTDNRTRLVWVELPETPVSAVRLVPLETWGDTLVHVFAFEVE